MRDDLVFDVRGLRKSFGGRVVVDDVSLSAKRGTIFGFLGPNGSGKTTTIRMVCGLLRPDAGEGQVLGHDLKSEGANIRARIGYMTQKFSLYEDLSIRENLEFVARLYGLSAVRSRVDEALERLGLAARERQLAGALSGGWKQRLALAACMIHAPELLLLDEPTAGVDPKARRDFWEQIRAFSAEGVTTLVSTHYMDEAVQCDQIAFIAFGKKLLDERTAAIPGAVGLAAFELTGPDLPAIEARLRAAPGVDVLARFGADVHACGKDRAMLLRAVETTRALTGVEIREIEAGLEDIFIYLIGEQKSEAA